MPSHEEKLWQTSKSGNVSEARRLLDRNLHRKPVNINYKDKDRGSTCVFVAADKGHYGVLQLLIQNRADVNIPDKDGWLPIHAACRGNSSRCVELLLKNGSLLDVGDNEGETPLMVAAYEGQTENARLLLDAGADVDQRNDNGETAYERANNFGHAATAELIQSYEKGPKSQRVEAPRNVENKSASDEVDSSVATPAPSNPVTKRQMGPVDDELSAQMVASSMASKASLDPPAVGAQNRSEAAESDTTSANSLEPGKTFLCHFGEKKKFSYEEYSFQPSSDIEVKKARTLTILSPHKGYKTFSKKRGYLFLCNNSNFYDEKKYPTRVGSEIDENNMLTLFSQLGFDNFVHHDLTFRQAQDTLYKFSRRDDLSEIDVLIVCFMSHGEFGKIIFTDGEKHKTEDIMTIFDNKFCKQLKGIPKIFLFQACRGIDVAVYEGDSGYTEAQVNSAIRSTIQDTVHGSENLVDALVGYSVRGGYISLRNEKGSPFVKILVKVISEQAHDTDIRTMLETVNMELTTGWGTSSQTQPAEVVGRGFNKHLYLNPGLWKEE